MNYPYLAVVIPTYNEAAHIAETLNALREGLYPRKRLTILVADGRSTDQTREIVRSQFKDVMLVDNPERIQAAGINHAVAQCDSRIEWIVRCDCHAIYPLDFLTQVATMIEQAQPNWGIITWVTHLLGGSCFQNAAGWAYMSKLGGGAPNKAMQTTGPVEHSWHGAISRAAFDKVGGYRLIPTAEDVDLSSRLRATGYVIWNDHNVMKVGYVARGNIRGVWRQMRGYGDGRARLIQLGHSAFRLRHIPLLLIGPWTALVLLTTPIFPLLWLTLLFYMLLIGGTSIFAAIKERSICLLWLGAILPTMHYSWCWGFLRQWFRKGRIMSTKPTSLEFCDPPPKDGIEIAAEDFDRIVASQKNPPNPSEAIIRANDWYNRELASRRHPES